MIDFLLSMSGMVIVLLPALLFFNYLMTRVSKKTKFDCHLKNVKDKKGNFGVFLAYFAKVLLFSFLIMLGLSFMDNFENVEVLKWLLIFFVGYLIINYFDNQNEK